MLVILFTASGGPVIEGQSLEEFDQKVRRAYVTDSLELWQSTLSRMEDRYKRSPADSLLLHLTIHQYGLIGYLIEVDREAAAEHMIQQAQKNSEQLKKRDFCAEARAIQAGLVGFRIGMSPWKAPFLGDDNQRLIKQARQCDPENPMVWIQKAHAFYHRPAMFGGSKKIAAQHFETAIVKFAMKDWGFPAWLYLDTLIHYAKSLEKMGKKNQAREVYKKVWKRAPQMQSVKKRLRKLES